MLIRTWPDWTRVAVRSGAGVKTDLSVGFESAFNVMQFAAADAASATDRITVDTDGSIMLDTLAAMPLTLKQGTTSKMAVNADGTVTLSTASTTVTGLLTVTDATQAASSSDASVTLSGGLGVAKDTKIDGSAAVAVDVAGAGQSDCTRAVELWAGPAVGLAKQKCVSGVYEEASPAQRRVGQKRTGCRREGSVRSTCGPYACHGRCWAGTAALLLLSTDARETGAGACAMAATEHLESGVGPSRVANETSLPSHRGR